jgi:hypothetical protein
MHIFYAYEIAGCLEGELVQSVTMAAQTASALLLLRVAASGRGKMLDQWWKLRATVQSLAGCGKQPRRRGVQAGDGRGACRLRHAPLLQ